MAFRFGRPFGFHPYRARRCVGLYNSNMKPKVRKRVDTSTPVEIDLSPAVIAARVRRLDQVRRTALAARPIRAALESKYGRTKS
jgi:hypothetical protein